MEGIVRQKELSMTTLKTVIFELKTFDISFRSFITRNIIYFKVRLLTQEIS